MQEWSVFDWASRYGEAGQQNGKMDGRRQVLKTGP